MTSEVLMQKMHVWLSCSSGPAEWLRADNATKEAVLGRLQRLHGCFCKSESSRECWYQSSLIRSWLRKVLTNGSPKLVNTGERCCKPGKLYNIASTYRHAVRSA